MFTTGLPLIAIVFFAAASMMVVIPSTIQVFAWTLTVTMGRPLFKAPLMFIGGFIVFFVLGGLSGISFAAVPIDQATTDTYYVVAHFHFIIFGAAVFPLLGGLFYWFPKVTGRLYNERLAQAGFWLTFAGTAITFFPMHIAGWLGMTRRIYTYPSYTGWGTYNLIESVGGFILAAGLVLIAFNLFWSRIYGPSSGRDPFFGGTLEWTTASPPPHYNFAVIPRVSSPYPNWDVADREEDAQDLDRGARVFEDGHETPATTVKDGYLDDVLEMPSESGWPIVIAVCLTLLFVLVLLSHYLAALAFAGLAALALAVWHWREPEPEPL
jgi:cytochrome c oxidase subunit 1/cytochrome c oxidase subunit I+III